MTIEVASIRVKKQRGHMIVEAMGRTGKGQSYVKGTRVLKARSSSDPGFKAQVDTAVKSLLDGETAPQP